MEWLGPKHSPARAFHLENRAFSLATAGRMQLSPPIRTQEPCPRASSGGAQEPSPGGLPPQGPQAHCRSSVCAPGACFPPMMHPTETQLEGETGRPNSFW